MESTQEQEISLSELIWKIFLGWRRLFVMGLIFAVIVSTLQYIREQAAWKRSQSRDSVEKEVLLPQEEEAKIDDIITLQKRMDEARDYQKNSIWMNLDAYNEDVLILRYYVDSDYTFNYLEENSSDYTKDIIAAYCSCVSSGMIADVIAEELNMPDRTNYISELITAKGGDVEDKSRNVFEVVVAYSDAEVLEQIKPVISEAIEGQTKRISNEVGSHTLKLLTENVTVRVDKDLILTQKEKNDTMYNYHVQLAALETDLSEGQMAALNRARTEESESEEKEETEMVRPAFHMKFVALGFIFGVFFACAWIFLEMLFGSKLQGAEEISKRYGVRILGDIKVPAEKKKVFHIVDDFLIKLKDRNAKQITQEQRILIAGSNLEVACMHAGTEQIYVTGSKFEKCQDGSLEKVWKDLSEAGIQVYKGTNIVYDAGAIKEMVEIGSVVFVEQVGDSLYAEVEKEIQAAKENGTRIIGSVILS